jgi:predicted Zn-dependent protease
VKFPFRALAIAWVVFLLGRAALRAEEPQVAKAIYNSFSDEEEMTMGRAAAEETEKKYPILRDAALDTYLSQAGEKVAQASRRPQLKYYFKIVNTPIVNAFSLPGGYVYVHRGLIEFVRSESELVGVLAHEVGHIVAYHSMNDVARRWLVDRLVFEGKKAGLLTDQQMLATLEQYGGPVLLFVNRKFSREEENEADLLAIYNAQRAGWDPNGLIVFLQHIGESSGTPGLMEMLLRKHPLPQDRVDTLRAEVKLAAPAADLAKDSPRFKTFGVRVQSLPPAPEVKAE